MDFRTCYTDFLERLDAIADTCEELTDTEVRERMREVIEYYFVWDQPIDADFPRCYAMFTETADAQVAAAVHEFVVTARRLAQAEGLAPGAARHAAIEDATIETDAGTMYDEYLGSTDAVTAPVPPAADALYLSDANP